ncbi:adenosylcobinamide-GDP ribazoletransferase [Paenibacillus sp.]|uniref:adenosylcobinamide-GDP ribazoletransferase n=1 Tax=Paenibacillus sp. TaxID=58172 RepID=UPI002D39ABD3|nr:adenosylcobinamide-GDP ribazoletransferase [Paenibacillus sp.]HZG83778.1 adenosylcobinamide-GDP ribazoletransferase [Paenibacillus sp.]
MRGGLGHMGDWIKAASAAVRLMTCVPVPDFGAWNERVLRRSIVFYPLAGAVVGGIVGAAYALLPLALPEAAAAAVATALWVWATGALHLDGWMDVADAFGSRRSRERMLEIMKDPRVGASGAAAGALLLLGKFAFVLSLMEYTAAGSLWMAAAVAAVPVVARMFAPWAVVGWPYAGGSGGMGAALRSAGWRHAAASLGVGIVCAAALLAVFGTGDAVMLLPAAAAGLALAAAVGAAGAAWIARRLGGLTGDAYGALIEGLELALLLALVAAGHSA